MVRSDERYDLRPTPHNSYRKYQAVSFAESLLDSAAAWRC
jgi:hypothetical protein